MATSTEDITGLLMDWSRGRPGALERLISSVYAELHRIAQRQIDHERADHTLQPTALVHEAYLRLLQYRSPDWKDRAHFFGSVSSLMRRVLVDYARRKRAAKRSPAMAPDVRRGTKPGEFDDWVALDEALGRLKALSARQARAVELRYFAGLTVEETAQVLEVSSDRVERDWTVARAWLLRELGG